MKSSAILLNVLLIFCVFNVGLCEVLVELNCETDGDCNQFQNAEYQTSCLDSHCVCKITNGNFTKCQPMSSKISNIIGGPCPCRMSHSECNTDQDICYCLRDYVGTMDKRRCIKEKLVLGETCENDSQCIKSNPFAECNLMTKNCACQRDFVDHAGLCVSAVALNEICETNRQCQNHTMYSICVKNQCVCDKGYVASPANIHCLPAAGYNEPCSTPNQCIHAMGPGSECYSGFCTCDYKHFLTIPDESKGSKVKRCELTVELGQYCREHNYCYQYHLKPEEQTMECYYGQCSCRAGFYDSNSVCVRSAAPAHFINNIMLIISVVALFKFIF